MISYTLSKQEFLQFQSAFRARAKAGSISSPDMVLYNIVRGKPANHGFTAITNTRKLQNGADRWEGYKQAKYFATYRLQGQAKNKHFKDLYNIELTDEQFATFLATIKEAA